MPNLGDKVQIITKQETIEGILIPTHDSETIFIKLESGYNAGFNKKDITKITLLEKAQENKSLPASSISKNPSLPIISILHTGGTIASKVDYRTGGVVASFSPEDLISLFPELNSIANIHSELISKMWSDDLRFKHFTLIAEKIEAQIKKGVKGIIIGIGTDNLAVASAALSFIIEQTPIPIILVGSQRSSDRGSSDAALNLINAAYLITHSDFADVAICMHTSENDTDCYLLSANKTYKLHSSRRDAFQSINTEAIAKINYQTKSVQFLTKDYKKRSSIKPIIKSKMEEKVAILKIHINMFPEQFSFYEGYKGLIIEGTGLGHTPGQVPNPECEIHKKIYPAIKKVIQSGCIIIMTTQCLYGTVNMNIYDKGRDLLDLGVISGEDMLANTALVKLSWLLGNYKSDEAKKLISQNLRGEINPQHQYKEKIIDR